MEKDKLQIGIKRPFHRICRPHQDGTYTYGGQSKYIRHPKYATSPEHYIRAFLLIQKDLTRIFDYVEPADENLNTYSYRIHELFMRTCIEVEANFKAIFSDNGYLKKSKKHNITTYKKINASHNLRAYFVKVPYWHGTKNIRQPFLDWDKNDSLKWYRAYNSAKHDRYISFKKANLNNLIDAVCGLVALLSAQFNFYDFAPSDDLLSVGGPNDGMESAIGNYFRIKYPIDWALEDSYNFHWEKIRDYKNPFVNYDYSKIK